MKVFVFIAIAVIAVSAQTDEQKEKLKNHVKVCAEKIQIPLEAAQKLFYTVVEDDSEKNKCFVKCILEQSEFIDAAGNFQKDIIFDKLSVALGGKGDPEVAKHVNELIETCTVLTGTGECGTPFEVNNCYWRKIKST